MSKRILIVVDMQNDFITGPLGNSECANVVDRVADIIKTGAYDEIYVTYDTHDENYLKTNEGKHLPVSHCMKGTTGYELDEKIKRALDSTLNRNESAHNFVFKAYEKPTFGSMDMAINLMNQREEFNQSGTQIDFCGVCTGICVISNVMLAKAAVPEANIRVIANACACVTPESHNRALEAMKMCHIEVVE